jgi:hypothetical protein
MYVETRHADRSVALGDLVSDHPWGMHVRQLWRARIRG